MDAVDVALTAARAVLAATFFVAGTAKLVSSKALLALRDFGVPRRVQPALLLLPWVELAIAVGLLFTLTAWHAAWAALVLLAVFIVGIAWNLARGRHIPCNCFGQVRRTPIGAWTLVRNGALAGAAWWIVQNGVPPAAADLWVIVSGLDTQGRIATTVIAVGLALALMFLLGDEEGDQTSLADLDMPTLDEMLGRTPAAASAATPAPPPAASRRTLDAPIVKYAAPGIVLNGDGLPIGMAAPPFELPDVHGQMHSLTSLLAGGSPALLVFTSPHCESCQALVPKLPALAAQHAETLRVVLVSKGTVQQAIGKVKDPGALLVLFQQEYEVAESFNSTTSPDAVLVSADGTIASTPAHGGTAILELIGRS